MIREMISNIALLTTFLFFFNLLFKRKPLSHQAPLRLKIAVGSLHGLFSLLLMFFSVGAYESAAIDFRQIMIISAASLGGLPAALIAAFIVTAGRLLYFGVDNLALLAAASAFLLAVGSSLIARRADNYWRMWAFSLGLSALTLCCTIYILFPERSLYLIPGVVSLVVAVGLYYAFLSSYFRNANKLQRDLENSERSLRNLHSMQEAILQAATGIAIITVDRSGKITLFNSGAEKMLGYGASELVHREKLLRFHSPSELQARAKEMSQRLGRPVTGTEVLTAYAATGDTDEREWTYTRKDGTALTVNLIMTAIRADGEIIGFMGVASDVTARKEAERKLREANEMLQELSMQDGLTGIANRRQFDETLEREWRRAEREGHHLGLILFDIDYFKRYNDCYGHQAGDECLKNIAIILRLTVLRRTDLPARYGGEEFAVILPNTDLSGTVMLAEKIRHALAVFAIPHRDSPAGELVTISAGAVSLVPRTDMGIGDLIARADSGLYEAKLGGRNRVQAYAGAETAV